MTVLDPRRLAMEVIDAHGGLSRWNQLEALQVSLSSGGLAFRIKGHSQTLQDIRVVMATSGQRIMLEGAPPAPWTYSAGSGPELAGDLARLRTGSRQLRWGVGDVAAFAASAAWTYFQLPFILASPDLELDLDRAKTGGESHRLKVRFPAWIATHCPVQILHFGEDRIIRRHDYTALAFGRWAKAAHFLNDHQTFEGLLIPTRRRVVPRLGTRPAPGPELVWIKVDNVTASAWAPGSPAMRQRA